MIWNNAIDNFVTPLDTIDSDRIVGIKCTFANCRPLFILAVYLPSSNHALEEFKECLDYLWALYDFLSADGFVILLGEFNGDLGNSLGDKGKKEPNDRGLLLLDFANFFNICPVNLLKQCKGPLESFNSHCGRYHSALDYIFLPNCLLNDIDSPETFYQDVDNTSDHLPILVNLKFSERLAIDLDCYNHFGSGAKRKIHWSNFSHETINVKYVTPLLVDLTDFDISESNDTETVTKTITNLLLKHSYSLSSPGSNRNRKRKHGVYVRLPDDVKVARSQCKIAFSFWKQDQFSVNSIVHDNYRSKRKDYRLALRNFLNHLEVDRVKKLCAAAETDEKLFWKLLKGQRSSSQMSAFLVNGAFITEENDIRDMWADHFEVLGTPTVSFNFDNEFANSISTHVQNIFQNYINDPTGALNEPLTYEEVAGVCSNLKPGVSGVSLDYEHVGYAGPPLWRLLFHLYQQFF